MASQIVQMGPKGRVVVPAAYREALGLQPGDDLLVALEGQELRLISRKEALRRIREEVSAAAPPERVLSEELLAERRAEATEPESKRLRNELLSFAGIWSDLDADQTIEELYT